MIDLILLAAGSSRRFRASGSGSKLLTLWNGRPMYRTAVFDAIQRLSRDACVPEEKCNPRCLRRLWQATRADLAENVRWLV